MKNAKEKWLARLHFIKGFLLGVIFLLILGMIFQAYILTAQGECMVQHHVIMNALKTYIDSGNQPPENLTELASLKYTSQAQSFDISDVVTLLNRRYNFKYNPNAWNKAGRILLQNTVFGSFVITFGDGSQGTLSHWRRKYGEEAGLQGPAPYGPPPAIALFIFFVASLLIVLIGETTIRKKLKKELVNS